MIKIKVIDNNLHAENKVKTKMILVILNKNNEHK